MTTKSFEQRIKDAESYLRETSALLSRRDGMIAKLKRVKDQIDGLEFSIFPYPDVLQVALTWRSEGQDCLMEIPSIPRRPLVEFLREQLKVLMASLEKDLQDTERLLEERLK